MAKRASEATSLFANVKAAARLCSLAAATVLLVCQPVSSLAHKNGCVVVIIAGAISIRDLADTELPNISAVFREGSAGLMNVRTGRPTPDIEPTPRPGMLPGCLSLGAGAMASGGLEVGRAYDFDSPLFGTSAAHIYASRTGVKPAPCTVLHVEIAKMARINESAAYRARPGLLGNTLRASGVKTFVIGNSDLPAEIHREAAAVAMDGQGIVDGGTVSSSGLVRRDPAAAYGMSSDVALLARLTAQHLGRRRFIVVDFGDSFRADFYADLCDDSQASTLRRKAISRLDRLVGLIRADLNPKRDTLILLSPCTRTATDFENERLAPLLIQGPGYRSGLLTSPSTRRMGVVTLADVAPTILGIFGIDVPPGMTGRRIHSCAPHLQNLEHLLRLNAESIMQADRLPLMRASSVVQSILVILATLVIVAYPHEKLMRAARWAAVLPAVVPLAMLYMPAFYRGGLAGSAVILCALVAAAAAFLVLRFESPSRALMWTCGLLAASLLVDLARGAALIKWSVAGYSLADGARYYGIGNELMGTMLGATVIFVCLSNLLDAVPAGLRTAFSCAVFVTVFAFLGAPGLGAEAGGAIGAAIAFTTTLVARSTWRPSGRDFALLAAASLLALVTLFGIDALRGGGSQSHVGRALGLLASGDSRAIVAIAARKIGLNVMLLSTSLWSRLLFTSLAAAALLYWRDRPECGGSGAGREYCGALIGLAVCVLTAFVLNDSGVVAAAACSVLRWSLVVVGARDE